MIHTPKQLKDLVRNLSSGNSMQAQILIRNYMMERFLERLSRSPYQKNFILKGGALVSAMVGVDTRSTMDIDTTLRGLPLTVDDISDILAEIVSIPLEDGITFHLSRISEIMDEAEYPGIRVTMEAELGTMRTPLKLNISTGDAITPREISYQFKLMFEDRSICILAYNLETVLAEKLDTVLSRGAANTRLRDYYDLYILQHDVPAAIDHACLRSAFMATCAKRGTQFTIREGELILSEIYSSADLQLLWRRYQSKYSYAAHLSWDAVMDAVRSLYRQAAGS